MAAAPVRRGRARRSYQPMSEINVTPFVDVMLVLLVIFMVTAPLLTVAVPVDLPKAAAVGKPDKPLIVSVRADGTVFLQETRMDIATLIARLRAIARVRDNPRIFVRGDKAVPYGRVMQVMSSISTAGFPKVALVAEDGKE